MPQRLGLDRFAGPSDEEVIVGRALHPTLLKLGLDLHQNSDRANAYEVAARALGIELHFKDDPLVLERNLALIDNLLDDAALPTFLLDQTRPSGSPQALDEKNLLHVPALVSVIESTRYALLTGLNQPAAFPFPDTIPECGERVGQLEQAYSAGIQVARAMQEAALAQRLAFIYQSGLADWKRSLVSVARGFKGRLGDEDRLKLEESSALAVERQLLVQRVLLRGKI